jgi:hypothetical protein
MFREQLEAAQRVVFSGSSCVRLREMYAEVEERERERDERCRSESIRFLFILVFISNTWGTE